MIKQAVLTTFKFITNMFYLFDLSITLSMVSRNYFACLKINLSAYCLTRYALKSIRPIGLLKDEMIKLII